MLPSGDQSGCSAPASLVTCLRPVPSGLMVNNCRSRRAWAWKTILPLRLSPPIAGATAPARSATTLTTAACARIRGGYVAMRAQTPASISARRVHAARSRGRRPRGARRTPALHARLELSVLEWRHGQRRRRATLRAQTVEDDREIAAPQVGLTSPAMSITWASIFVIMATSSTPMSSRSSPDAWARATTSSAPAARAGPAHGRRAHVRGGPRRPARAVPGRSPGARGCRRGTAPGPSPRILGRERLLRGRQDRVHAVVEERVDQLFLVAEAPVHRPDADARAVGDVVERDFESTRREDLAGGREDQLAVAGGVAAEGPLVAVVSLASVLTSWSLQ